MQGPLRNPCNGRKNEATGRVVELHDDGVVLLVELLAYDYRGHQTRIRLKLPAALCRHLGDCAGGAA